MLYINSSNHLVTEMAWKTPFKGSGHTLLKECITSMNGKRENVRFRSFTSIIQSSGMGKSRVVDEIAKLMFTIPLNLREEKDKTGESRPSNVSRIQRLTSSLRLP